jgi:hypothetical protein
MHNLFAKYRSILIFLLVFLAIWLINYCLGPKLMGNMKNHDFMSLWAGGKAVTLGLDPYDPEVWPDLRARFGSTWIPDPTCPFPLWTLAAFAPISFLSVPAASALITTVSELSLLLAVSFILNLMECSDDKTLMISALLGAIFFRPFLVALVSGQITPFLTLALAYGIVLYHKGQSLLSGLVFTLLLFKPNLPTLFLPALVLIFLTRRDWQGLLGLVMGSSLLFVSSWLLQPRWLLRWLSKAAEKAQAMPMLWGLTFDLVGSEQWMLVGTLAFVVTSVFTLFIAVRWHDKKWQLAMGLAMCSSLFVAPYLWNHDQVLLLVPALIALCSTEQGHLLQIGIWLIVILFIPWGFLWIATLRGLDTLSALVTLIAGVYLLSFYRDKQIPTDNLANC